MKSNILAFKIFFPQGYSVMRVPHPDFRLDFFWLHL